MEKRYNDPEGYHYNAFFSKRHPAHIFHRNKNKKILKFIPRGSKVLDAGCGCGVLCYLMRENDCIVYGLDIERKHIHFASQKFDGINFLVGNILNFKLKTKFDVIICADVIEHFNKNEREKIINNLDKHLKKSGIIILTFPSKFYISIIEKIWHPIRKVFYPKSLFDDQINHFAIRTLDLIILLNKKKYILEKAGSINFWIVKYIILRKM